MLRPATRPAWNADEAVGDYDGKTACRVIRRHWTRCAAAGQPMLQRLWRGGLSRHRRVRPKNAPTYRNSDLADPWAAGAYLTVPMSLEAAAAAPRVLRLTPRS